MRQPSRKRRRSAAQWAKLLASWDRNTLSPTAFARSLGVAPGTLAWWRWRLKDPSARTVGGGLRLVQVELDQGEAGRGDPSHGWEMHFAQGVTLRAQSAMTPEVLRVVLTHLTLRATR